VIALGAGLPRLRTDNTLESFLLPSDPDLVEYREFQRVFGQDRMLLIGVETDSLISEPFLERLEAFHRDLEREVPHIAEVMSLVNVRSTEGVEGSLVVGELFERLPASGPERLRELKSRLESTPLYRKALLAHDMSMTAVAIEPALGTVSEAELLAGFDDPPASEPGAGAQREGLMDSEVAELLAAVRAAIDRYEQPGFELYLSGDLPDNDYLTTLLEGDAAAALLASLMINAIILAVLFRSIAGVVLPLFCVMLSLVASFGLIALLDIPFSPTLSILPRVVIVASISNAVHLLSAVYLSWPSAGERRAALREALRIKAVPIAIASLTTAAGLASFAGVGIGQTANLGFAAPIAVGFALLLSLVLLPALIALSPMGERRSQGAESTQAWLAAWLVRIGGRAAMRPGATLALSGAVALVGLAGVLQLRFEAHPLSWLPPEDEVYQNAQRNNDAFQGVVPLEILITSPEPGGIRNPEFLRRIEAIAEYLDAEEDVELEASNAVSIVDVVKETHRALNEGRDEFYAIPDDPALLAQELLLFESAGRDEMADVADATLSTARITARVPYFDQMQYPELVDRLSTEIEARLAGQGTVQITGATKLFAKFAVLLSSSMTQSYLVALVLIGVLMAWVLRSIRLGLLSMVPNLFPVLMTLGVMGWLGFPLDGSIMVVGCVIIGLAVDDTIHFMETFGRHLEESSDVMASIRNTLESVGPAMLTTSLVLTAGFLSSMMAYLNNVYQFGVAAITGIAFAFLADLIIVPALIALFVAKERTA
jgi:hypothetical protein